MCFYVCICFSSSLSLFIPSHSHRSSRLLHLFWKWSLEGGSVESLELQGKMEVHAILSLHSWLIGSQDIGSHEKRIVRDHAKGFLHIAIACRTHQDGTHEWTESAKPCVRRRSECRLLSSVSGSERAGDPNIVPIRKWGWPFTTQRQHQNTS